jgi:preprotein translocase subunit SecE
VEEVLPALQQAAGAQGIEVMATEVMTGTGSGSGASPESRSVGRIGRFVQFLREVRNELRKVTWPTFDELKKATTVIIIFVMILGLAIGLMDSFFQELFVKLVARMF